MPTAERRAAISLDEAHARAGSRGFPPHRLRGRLGKVGIESEFFPIQLGPLQQPSGRAQLEGEGSVIEAIDQIAATSELVGSREGPEIGPWRYQLAAGGWLTFEPGAQIECSTAAHASAAQALAETDQTLALLRQEFAARSTVLAAVGIDLWHDVEDVPQQLRAPRYTAMAHYYDLRGPWGAVMMRNTASLQLNLDHGPDGVRQERWLLANLISPLMTATFACSPGQGHAALRARAWQELDPTRTGFPDLLVNGPGNDPEAAWGQAALDADVLLIRQPDGASVAGMPGWSFANWIKSGHPRHGWPTTEDLDYHLTTLFFEVRPRGFLELRAGEALPDSLRAAPVVLVAGALYDNRARELALAELAELRGDLPGLWRRAARAGLADGRLAELANKVWSIALHGAERLPASYFGADALSTAALLLDRYTQHGRMPGDDLAQLQEQDPAAALAWAVTGPKD
jgi:glutamate--cysteine ligase